MKTVAMIMAGGASSRFGKTNKLLEKINGKEVICYTIEAFEKSAVDEIVICANKSIISDLQKMFFHKIVEGGATRQESVSNGLNAIDCDYVLIHDAARPMITPEIINNTIELVIQSRKEEIEIMRLMGVSNWYIKTPLVLQGAIYGFLGAIVAIIPINVAQEYILKMHEFCMIPIDPLAQFTVLFSVLTLGVAFSSIGSFLSIKKHLQV